MIRINLLPFRAIRKRENIKRQVTIFALVLLFLGSVMGWYYIDLSGKLSTLQKEEAKVKKDLASYQKTLNKIKSLEKTIKSVRAKLNVIKALEKGKSGPVLLLSEISDAVPKGKLWLKSLNEKRGSLSLTGTAMDNATVALFMDNLKASKQIGSVDLKSAKLRDLNKYKLKVSDFVLTCTVVVEEDKPEKTKKKKR
ncbi:MAG: PilN domain-containing protein [Pseudomonadota bacterium]